MEPCPNQWLEVVNVQRKHCGIDVLNGIGPIQYDMLMLHIWLHIATSSCCENMLRDAYICPIHSNSWFLLDLAHWAAVPVYLTLSLSLWLSQLSVRWAPQWRDPVFLLFSILLQHSLGLLTATAFPCSQHLQATSTGCSLNAYMVLQNMRVKVALPLLWDLNGLEPLLLIHSRSRG